jgi:protein-S-isoprenylcysteine O-methyltransferase Ste14
MERWLVFLAISAALTAVSRASLRAPRSHGFWRYFAWESEAALVCLNAPAWLDDPFSPRQLAAWALLAISIVLALRGVWLLQQVGKPGPERPADVPLIGLERTTRLVTRGAYRWIRHPLYSSLLFLGWGAFLKDPGWLPLGLAMFNSLMLELTARAEEGENLRFFGDEYRVYMARTRRFIPLVW